MSVIINQKILSKLNALLDLKSTGEEQNWEIELAEPLRIFEFVEIIKKGTLNNEENHALTALLVASFDEYLQMNGAVSLSRWNAIKNVLNYEHHRDILEYWAMLGRNSPLDLFAITPMIRSYLTNQRLSDLISTESALSAEQIMLAFQIVGQNSDIILMKHDGLRDAERYTIVILSGNASFDSIRQDHESLDTALKQALTKYLNLIDQR